MAASAPTHAQLIQASWARCRDHGLQPQHAPDFDCLTRAELMEKIKGHVLKNSSVVRRYHR